MMPLRKRKKGGFYQISPSTDEDGFVVVSIDNTGGVKKHGAFTTKEEAIAWCDKLTDLDKIVYYVYGQDTDRAIYSTEER